MNTGKPYTDYIINDQERIRVFCNTINDDVLIWHVDEHDRSMFSLTDSDWLFQFDNELPFLINKRQIIKIPKMTYHRIIKGTKNLILYIKEV